MEILGKIYVWFESLFGQNLAEYLWGYNCATQIYSGPNLFNVIGIISLAIALFFVLAYYYLPLPFFNHPRYNRWWNWLIILFVAGIINFFIAYNWTINDFLDGTIGDCLMYTRDENGQIIAQLIFEKNCWLFGLTNFIVSSMFFIVGTSIFIWKSRNCKHSPIRTDFLKQIKNSNNE